MAGGCIFCGGALLTREHLWPDWLRREPAIPATVDHYIEQDSEGVAMRDVTFSCQPFNHVVKAVCGTCNGGWMSLIEIAAKPLLQELFTDVGEPGLERAAHPGDLGFSRGLRLRRTPSP